MNRDQMLRTLQTFTTESDTTATALADLGDRLYNIPAIRSSVARDCG